jgi:hypothetical protein
MQAQILRAVNIETLFDTPLVMRPTLRVILIYILTNFISACSEIQILDINEKTFDRSYFGYVRIQSIAKPPLLNSPESSVISSTTSEKIMTVKSSTLGAIANNDNAKNFSIGWIDEKHIFIPMQCQVVIIINGPEQFIPPGVFQLGNACLIDSE